MKKLLSVLALISSFSVMANEVYKNNTGCNVEKETRANGVVFYVDSNNKHEVVGIANDYSFGTFVYCDDKAMNINYVEGSKGTGILIYCSAHENGHAVTRGRVDIDIMGGELKNISIDGQVKKLFGWKQDTKIECLDLVKQ